MDSNLTDFRVKVANTFTYGPETILSLKKTKSLMEPNGNAGLPSVGNCISGQIDLTIKRVSDVIPSMAQIDILVDASVNNIKQGTYYIDTRQNDSAEDTIYEADSTKFHCYDSMLKCEQYIYIADKDEVELWSSGKAYSVDDVVKYSNNYYICIKSHTSSSSFDSSKWELTDIGDQGTWPKTDIQVVQIIANRIGVQLESHVSTIINKAYQIEYPGYGEDAYTLKELLSYIGGMYAGNWFINDEGKLQLVQLVNSYAKTINVINYEDCTTNEQTKPYSKVRIETGTEYYYTAGDDTGAELVIDCPWGSSQMANDILNIVRGFVYQPFEVANWIPSSNDISFELGDKVVIGDKESYIYSIDIDYDYLLTADISAPFDSEIDHEYTFKQKTLRQLTHENRDIRTSLRVQKGQIEGLIEGEIKTYRSSIDPSLTHEMHIGDLWYCLAATGDYKVNTWYRWSGSSWEETTSSIPVAEDWSSTKTYSKGNYVTGPDGKWYESKLDSNTNHEPPNTTWWKETDTISAMSKSQILQTIGTINLAVEKSGGVHSIVLSGEGITMESPVPIKVSSLNIDGAITFSQIDDSIKTPISTAQTTANNASSAASAAQTTANDAASAASAAQTKANQAWNKADDAQDSIAGWTYESTTYIDGEMIMTGTVTASILRGGTVQLIDSNKNASGVFSITSASTGAYAIEISSKAAARYNAEDGTLYLSSKRKSTGDMAYISINGDTESVYIGGWLRISNYGSSEPSGTPPNGSLYFKIA